MYTYLDWEQVAARDWSAYRGACFHAKLTLQRLLGSCAHIDYALNAQRVQLVLRGRPHARQVARGQAQQQLVRLMSNPRAYPVMCKTRCHARIPNSHNAPRGPAAAEQHLTPENKLPCKHECSR